MEGSAERPLPDEGRKGKMSTKVIAVAIVAVLIIVVVLGAVLLTGTAKATTIDVAASSTVITAGESVTFDASNSIDKDGAISAYAWDFGDGTTGTGANVTHQYLYPGLYSVLLTITGPKGSTTGWYEAVSVFAKNAADPEEVTADTNETAPYATVKVNNNAVLIVNNTAVTFNASESYGYFAVQDEEGNWTIVDMGPQYLSNITWNFGDGSAEVKGTFEATNNVTHTYTGDGKLFPAYAEIESVTGVKQRFYVDITILPKDLPAQMVKNPNTFITATIGEPDTLDPAWDYETAGGEILQNVYETLIWYQGNSSSEFKPMLAKEVPTKANGLISADGKNYTFNLKQGIKFHDGKTMTAKDVLYSFQRLLALNDPYGPAWMVGEVLIPNYYDYDTVPLNVTDDYVEVVNDYTVTFHLVQEFPAFSAVMAFTCCSVVSSDYVENHGGIVEGEYNEWMNEHAAGTGPFMLTKWVRGQYILLTRFDQYHEKAASLKYVIIKKVDDVNVREMMLFSGNADSVYIPREHKYDVEGKAGLAIMQGYATFNIDFLGMNQKINTAHALNKDLKVPGDFFADKNIRMAMASVFDYDAYINDIFYGTAIQPNGAIPQGMFGYNASSPVYTYDLEAAAAFLENATNPAGGGSYADTGFELNLYYNIGNTGREAACKLLAKGLSELTDSGLITGTITCNAVGLDWPTYLSANRAAALPIFFLGWAPDYADPHDYVQPFLFSTGTYGGRCGIVNPVLDQWIIDAAAEGDLGVREQMYKDMTTYVYGEAYYVWTAQATNFHVEKSWVTGYYFNPMFSGLYYYALGKA